MDDAKSGEEALEKLREPRFDLVLLDMNMPGMSGLEACSIIRERSEIAIIMLTVRDTEAGQGLGARCRRRRLRHRSPSTRPSSWRACGRRLRRTPSAHGLPTGRLDLPAVQIDFDARQVTRGRRRIRLTPKEFDLLRFLVGHANKVVTHREILQAVWGPDYGEEVDHLRVVVNQLRKKIEAQPSKPVHILTEPWVGYRFQLSEPGTAQKS